MRRVANGGRLEWRQLVWGVVKDLEPIPSARRETDEEREDRELAALRALAAQRARRVVPRRPSMLDEFDQVSTSITTRRLDRMGIDEVIGLFGDPHRITRYAEPFGYWRQGSPRPAFADERPELMQAIGRCAAARIRMAGGPPIGASIHPRPCGWCGFPLEELFAACDWATWHGRHVVSDLLVWRLGDGSLYLREAGGAGVYGEPATFDFWALSSSERGRRVAAAIAASREGIAA